MTTEQPQLTSVLEELIGPDLIEMRQEYGELTAYIYPASIVRVLTLMRDSQFCRFKMLVDICGVDYPERQHRFDVVYHLLSVEHNQRLRIKLMVDGETPVPSVTEVYNAANWFEREVWDMYGVLFSDHPDLRRILTDYNFEGHPLRKDFPLTGYVEVRYDTEEKRVIYDDVKLEQEFRTFDFLSPWEGMLNAPNARIAKGEETYQQLPEAVNE